MDFALRNVSGDVEILYNSINIDLTDTEVNIYWKVANHNSSSLKQRKLYKSKMGPQKQI